VGKNVNKIGVWAIFAMVIFVSSCEKVEKDIAKNNLNETATHYEKPKIYDYDLCTAEVMRLDTIGYQLCCKANNACWNEVDSLEVRLSFPVLREYGFPKECQNFVKQKDSTAYYACCRKYNACWIAFYDENNKRTVRQLEYEIIQIDSSYYNVIKKNFERSVERELKKIDGAAKRRSKNVFE
jgi:hypothetical protein